MRRSVKGLSAGFVSNIRSVLLFFQIVIWTSTECADPSVPNQRVCGLDVPSKIDHAVFFNLSHLQKWSPWVYSFDKKQSTQSRRLEFKICGGVPSDAVPANDPCRDSSVCEIVGNSRTSFSTVSESTADEINFSHALMLYYRGSNCPSTSSKSLITVLLSCGQHLGYPRLVLETPCYTTFEWSTSGACTFQPKRQEVPCYAYNLEGQLHDLTSLIKARGSYEVETVHPEESFFINVCSEIVPDGSIKDLPSSSAAVFSRDGEVYGVGQLKSRLSFVGGSLQLIYEASASPELFTSSESFHN